MYRRPKDGLNFISRLFQIPGIQPGVPGLALEHFLYDSMHVLDLGVLFRWLGRLRTAYEWRPQMARWGRREERRRQREEWWNRWQ